MRRLALLVTLMMVLAAIPAGASSFPDVIPLPDGFQPEGVTVGAGHEIYAGSLADGSIYRADSRTGAGEIVVSGAESGDVAVGLDYDDRSGHLFVAGGPTGKAFVYDTDTGTMVAELDLAPGFINDVIVTRTAAYFTNSFAAELYAVPLERNGSIAGAPETIALGGDFQLVAGFNANGIEATADGRTLIVVNSATGELFTVDPATGDAALIDLEGDSVPSGDGIVLAGKTLYVVQNFLNQVAEIELDPSLESGQVVEILTSPDFRIPTTADVFGKSLYAVNARFDTPPTPDTEYEIVRIDR